jgi:hypothetical protein
MPDELSGRFDYAHLKAGEVLASTFPGVGFFGGDVASQLAWQRQHDRWENITARYRVATEGGNQAGRLEATLDMEEFARSVGVTLRDPETGEPNVTLGTATLDVAAEAAKAAAKVAAVGIGTLAVMGLIAYLIYRATKS